MEIKIENISFWYMSKRRKVLEDFSLQLQPDNIIGLIGRNGQGKTTLMKLLAGKNLPDKGTILYDGEEINKINVINKIVYASDELGYINRKLESIAKDYILKVYLIFVCQWQQYQNLQFYMNRLREWMQ